MNLLEIVTELIEGYLSGGAEEALAEGAEETVEAATGKDL